MTKNQLEYKKQINRIKRAIKRIEKKGFIFSGDIEEITGTTPKRITQKKLNEIKSIKPRNLYKYTQYVDMSTGEIFDYKEGKEIEKIKKQLKRGSINIPNTTTYELILEQIKEIKKTAWFISNVRQLDAYRGQVFSLEEVVKERYKQATVEYNDYLKRHEKVIMESLEIVMQYQKTIQIAFDRLFTILTNNEPTDEEKTMFNTEMEYINEQLQEF